MMELEDLKKLVESNARSIQAILEAQATDRLKREEEKELVETRFEELRQATLRIANLTEGLANWTRSLDDDRPTILRKLNTIETKLDQVLEGKKNGV